MTKPRDLSRRDVLRGALAAGAIAVAPSACGKPSGAAAKGPAPVKKRILILGGTGFLGPKTVAAALDRGHQVTIFNRGKREKYNPLELPVEHLYGNRDPDLPAEDDRGPDGKLLHPDATPKGLEQLAGHTWDAVIDNSGYFPRMVKASAELLAGHAGQYVFISSVSAYDDASIPAAGGDEDTRLATLADPTVETMGDQFQNYGGLKALCEQAAAAAFPGKATIVRPGYIVGPGDPTDRFTYWPVRISRGGDVLAPGDPSDPLQWIDVRDLAEWLVHVVEQGTMGTFNAVGPTEPARWGDVLAACNRAGGEKAHLEWVPSAWLDAHGTDEDSFPIWNPPTGKYAGFHRWSHARATAAGLRSRTIDDTVKAILDWYPGEIDRRAKVKAEVEADAKAKGAPVPPIPDPAALRAGLSPEREQALLAAWKQGGGDAGGGPASGAH
ncbi:MAG TPA: NAD-dependent epimerase/dehydratase family protein [Kofleriaceae bacterium]|nr:NAD-dependent epimerase/dehydratase family protein [Kofleriaceae bacterium]